MNIFGRKSKKDGGKSAEDKALQAQQLKVLGVPLAQAVRCSPSFDGVPLPGLVRECLDYVALYGLHVEGVYRVSSPKSRLDELELLSNTGRQHEIIFQDAHEAAGLLKRFLRQLPEHILTPQLRQQFEEAAAQCRCEAQCSCTAAPRLKELLLQLPAENFHLLAFVFRHAQLVIEQECQNKMGLAALGVLLQAMLDLTRNVVKTLITNAFDISGLGLVPVQLFDSVNTKPYIKPRSVDELRQNPPNTRRELEEEIAKQQNLLEYLHEQIQQMRARGKENKAKENEMWNVQTGITELKRQLKALGEKQTAKANAAGGGEAPAEDSDGDTVNSALLEKQLLAVQMALRDEIAEEKRQIAHLLSVLREKLFQLRSQLPPGEQNRLSESQRALCDESQRKSIVSVKSSNGFSASGGGGANEDGQSQASVNWEELCFAEEQKKEKLLGDLIRYRRICAQLRARLEHDTVLVKFKQQQMAKTADDVLTPVPLISVEQQPKADPNLLVTRF